MNGKGFVGVEMTTRDVSLEHGQFVQRQTHLCVPINGPGSILRLFASAILQKLRSIQQLIDFKAKQ